MNVRKYVLIFSVITLVLVGCNKEAPVTEQMYDHLEQSVERESEYLEYQTQITDLEIQEQEIYDQIVDLPMEEIDEINSLAKEALDIVSERQETLELEKESVEASKTEFLKVEPLIAEIDEDEVQTAAQKMYDQMIERYEAYENLYDAYKNSLILEKQFYEMIQNEETTHDEVSSHIDEINGSYEQVLGLNDEFNDATRNYNELKKSFYETAQMDVNYVED